MSSQIGHVLIDEDTIEAWFFSYLALFFGNLLYILTLSHVPTLIHSRLRTSKADEDEQNLNQFIESQEVEFLFTICSVF